MANFPATINITGSDIQSDFQTYSSFGLNGVRVIRERPNHRWSFSITIDIEKAGIWHSNFGFLASLKSGINKITIVHPSYPAAKGVLAVTPRVNGASQIGDAVAVDGLPASIAGLLLRGDIVTFQNDLKVYMLTADMDSDATGGGVLNIVPALRRSPADNATVVYDAVEFVTSITDVSGVTVIAPTIGRLATLNLIEELF